MSWRHPGQYRQAAEDSPRPADATVTGDFHELAALRSAISVNDGREGGRFVGGEPEIFPVNNLKGPCDFGVVVPAAIEVEAKSGSLGRSEGTRSSRPWARTMVPSGRTTSTPLILSLSGRRAGCPFGLRTGQAGPRPPATWLSTRTAR